jgi:hypothetical protein
MKVALEPSERCTIAIFLSGNLRDLTAVSPAVKIHVLFSVAMTLGER